MARMLFLWVVGCAAVMCRAASPWGRCYNYTIPGEGASGWGFRFRPRVELTAREVAWFNSLSSESDHAQVKATGSRPVHVRKEFRQLSSVERTRLKRALDAMKTARADPASSRSEYDVFIAYHMFVESPEAHEGASFLPWHREYLWRLERALQRYQPSVTLAYWDNRLDTDLPERADSVMWTPELIGNSEGPITSGFGAGWRASETCIMHDDDYLGLIVTRAAGANSWPRADLYNDNKIKQIMSEHVFEGIGCWGCCFEFYHNQVHAYIGGHMGVIECAPNDPIFWLHHSFVDYIWEEFRTKHQTSNPETDYPAGPLGLGGIGQPMHGPYAPMKPWPTQYNIHGMSNHYMDYYYSYAPSPINCTTDPDCGSPYLWCNNGRCASMVQPGGNCTGLPHNACYGSNVACSNGGNCVRQHAKDSPQSQLSNLVLKFSQTRDMNQRKGDIINSKGKL